MAGYDKVSLLYDKWLIDNVAIVFSKQFQIISFT